MNAFEQHAITNGGAVVHPGPPPDGPTPGGNSGPMPSGTVRYDSGNVGSVANLLYHITVQQDNIGSNSRTGADAGGNDRSVDITRYIDQNIGGKTGVRIVNGWTSGINLDWNRHQFRGRAVQFVRRNLADDTGPVGRTNFAGTLRTGVMSQFDVPPTLEEIYRSFVAQR